MIIETRIVLNILKFDEIRVSDNPNVENSKI